MKVKIFSAMRWICFLLVSLDIMCWLILLLIPSQMNICLWLISGVVLGALPLSICVWTIMTMENFILFNEQGVSRIRFGKVIKHFNWDEVKSIASTEENSFSGWIYISNEIVKFNNLSITRMRLSKNVIYLHMSKKAEEALRRYIPERFISDNK